MRTKQILINLISNAIKYTQSGSIVVEADIASDDTLLLKV